MAKVAGKSNVFTKLKKKGISKVHDAHKDDPLALGPINLPAGINNGVAKLIVAEIKEHEDGNNKGEPFASFQGVVRFPDSHNGVQIKNQRATLFIPLYDTPGRKKATFEDHYADFLNELRKFGIETAELEADDLEETLSTLVEEEPYFNFTTRGWTPPKTKEDPNPEEMVFTEFRGINNEYVDDTDPDAGVNSDDDEEEEEDGEPAPKAKTGAGKGGKSPKKAAPAEEDDEEEEEDDDEESTVSVGDTGTAPYDGEDFNVVVDVIEGDTLTVHNADDKNDVWDVDVSEFTPDEGGDEEEEEDEEEDVEIVPEVGDILSYNDAEVEITKVNTKKRTVNCTEVESEEEHVNVSWDDLTIEEE